MVPALLYLLLRKIIRKHWPNGLFLALSFISIAASGQQKDLKYQVSRNREVIGYTKISKSTSAGFTQITLESQIRVRFIFLFNVFAREEVTLQDGIITHTSQFRKMNGDVKENKEMRITVNGYEVYKGSTVERLPFSFLHLNILSLYFQEPVNVEEVYSDKFQTMIKVESLGNNKYRLKLPDGNSSIYHYKNGNCVKVEIDHSMYSAVMNLQ